MVFDESLGGAPVEGLLMEAPGGLSLRTDRDGAFHLHLPAGTHRLTLRRATEVITVTLEVISGETT